jgi:hypothetical protein
MIGGGSPNVIAPILKEWRETLTPEQQLRLPLAETPAKHSEMPLIISDLATELWTRAIVFATIECKGTPQALQLATMSDEAEQLRIHNRALADQVENAASENLSLREQIAQLQAIAKAAIDRASSGEERCSVVQEELRRIKLSMRSANNKAAAARRVAAIIRQASTRASHRTKKRHPEERKRAQMRTRVTKHRRNRSNSRLEKGRS